MSNEIDIQHIGIEFVHVPRTDEEIEDIIDAYIERLSRRNRRLSLVIWVCVAIFGFVLGQLVRMLIMGL